MKLKNILLLGLSFVIVNICLSQNSKTIETGDYAMPENLVQTPGNCFGFPEKEVGNILENFKNPPKGYGEVPFYWWTGYEPLLEERIEWQLDLLKDAPLSGINISYNHTHKKVDSTLNKGKNPPYGVPEPQTPMFMSKDWWNLWNDVSELCADRNIGLGLDDYVVGSNDCGYWTDWVDSIMTAKNYQGRIKIADSVILSGGEEYETKVSEKVITLVAYPTTNGQFAGGKAVDLLPLVINNTIKWKAPKGNKWCIFFYETSEGYMIHPQHGEILIANYFQHFEDSLSEKGRRGMNFFFQDELDVPIDNYVWSEDFVEMFENKKGYNISPYLPALYNDIGNITPKVRLDYYDVMVELVELRYFKPIFEWNWKRGLIYGCDNRGRGKYPSKYGDYFRVTRWFSAPGNDAARPQNGYSFIKTKVSSSIAHLYKRPRVWLEAYHSMGWNAKPSQIDFSTMKHFQFGANLLCLHGLYYTTHGGWWEWAAPDFHFRMPYWPLLKEWLRSAERMSYILSQGTHVCDVAIMYPVAPLQVKNGGSRDVAFSSGELLFNSGMDFDFIDQQSLNRSVIKDKQLTVSGENYKVLILADMTVMHHSSLEKALDFYNNGGVVIAVGQLPLATNLNGRNDAEVDRILSEIFGVTAKESTKITKTLVNRNNGVGIYFPEAVKDMTKEIAKYIQRDFYAENGEGSVTHRKIGNDHLFMVMDLPAKATCYFNAKGKPFLLNTRDGNNKEISIIKETETGTFLRLPNGETDANMIFFTEGEAQIEQEEKQEGVTTSRTIDGEWISEFVPTMDNKWGDFRLPATDELIGVEARVFEYVMTDEKTSAICKNKRDVCWDTVTYSYGPRFMMMNVDNDIALKIEQQIVKNKETIVFHDTTYTWEPYSYSMKLGVENHPGSQGYHGLKAKVSSDFIILNDNSYFFKTYVNSDKVKNVNVIISGREPDAIFLNGNIISDKLVTINKGINTLILSYRNIKQGNYIYKKHIVDQRDRSAVILLENGISLSETEQLSMKWYNQKGILNYDVYGGEQKHGYYRFEAPPGMTSMTFNAYGKVAIYVDGKKISIKKVVAINYDGLKNHTIQLPEKKTHSSMVCFEVEHQSGYTGGAAFPQPVKIQCGEGKISLGDWSEMGVLKTYSGGLWYKKDIMLTQDEVNSEVRLDLGYLCAGAEVSINGERAGSCIKSPFTLDISQFVKEGNNRLEILVYSTLANHYYTIPTPDGYKTDDEAGLIGPVKLLIDMK